MQCVIYCIIVFTAVFPTKCAASGVADCIAKYLLGTRRGWVASGLIIIIIISVVLQKIKERTNWDKMSSDVLVITEEFILVIDLFHQSTMWVSKTHVIFSVMICANLWIWQPPSPAARRKPFVAVVFEGTRQAKWVNDFRVAEKAFVHWSNITILWAAHQMAELLQHTRII